MEGIENPNKPPLKNFYMILFHRFGGKPCDPKEQRETRPCDYSNVPDCENVPRTASHWGDWGEWSDCAGVCGK